MNIRSICPKMQTACETCVEVLGSHEIHQVNVENGLKSDSKHMVGSIVFDIRDRNHPRASCMSSANHSHGQRKIQIGVNRVQGGQMHRGAKISSGIQSSGVSRNIEENLSSFFAFPGF